MSQERIDGQDYQVVLIGDPSTGLPINPATGMGVEDLLFIDDTGQQFIYRDSGATPPVFTAYKVPEGTAYTPGANPVPYSVKNVVATIADGGDVAQGARADSGSAAASWYTSTLNTIQLLKLLIATTVGAGSHAYGYTAGALTTDAWTLFGTTRTKTFGYTAGVLTSETDWV